MKRILSLFLALCLLGSFFPLVTVLAQEFPSDRAYNEAYWRSAEKEMLPNNTPSTGYVLTQFSDIAPFEVPQDSFVYIHARNFKPWDVRLNDESVLDLTLYDGAGQRMEPLSHQLYAISGDTNGVPTPFYLKKGSYSFMTMVERHKTLKMDTMVVIVPVDTLEGGANVLTLGKSFAGCRTEKWRASPLSGESLSKVYFSTPAEGKVEFKITTSFKGQHPTTATGKKYFTYTIYNKADNTPVKEILTDDKTLTAKETLTLPRGDYYIVAEARAYGSGNEDYTQFCYLIETQIPTSYEVTPKNGTVALGSTLEMKGAIDGKPVSGSLWKSSNPAIASIDENGLLTAKAAGTVTITGQYADLTDSATVTVTKGSLQITPRTDYFLQKGTSLTLTATYEGKPVTPQWSVSPESLATIDSGGKLTGLASGEVTVRASYLGAVDTEAFTIINASLAITPDGGDLAVGEELRLQAISLGLAVPARWSITPSDGKIATLDQNGKLKGIAPGQVSVTAEYGGLKQSATFTVKAGGLTVTPGTGTIYAGKTLALKAYQDGKEVTPAWTVSGGGIAKVDASGLVTGLQAGTVTVTAQLGEAKGTATITVQQGSLLIQPRGGLIGLGETLNLTATLDGKPVAPTWSSQDSKVATVGSGGLMKTTGEGTVSIQADYQGFQATTTFTVKQGVLTIHPYGGLLAKGEEVKLTATLDGKEVKAKFASSDNQIAWAQVVAPANHLYTYTKGGKEGEITLTARYTDPETGATAQGEAVYGVYYLEIRPETQRFLVGESQQFAAYLGEYQVDAAFHFGMPFTAEVTKSGYLTAKEKGLGNVYAQYHGIYALLDITVGMVEAPSQEEGRTPSPWARDGVTQAKGRHIVPIDLQNRLQDAITRAEFCALAVPLYELVKGEEITGRLTFQDTTDVNVEKAAFIGVVNGMGDNFFSPETKLTREQAATMLARLAAATGSDLPKTPPTFADNGKISSWAYDAVGQVQGADIMNGVGGGFFDPQGPYTREQSVVTMMRLYHYLAPAVQEA